jgi:probable F420-dependent oxidoreductase
MENMSSSPLRFALATPVVTLHPKRYSAWEEDAGIDALRQIALAAEKYGFHHVTCSEHVGVPEALREQRGYRYYDPLSTFGYMAAITTRLRFLTHVVVLPYHHPLAVAKRYGTLDRVSNGRLILGIGVGSLAEEFQLLGAEFERRGEIYSEALAALRSALGRKVPFFKGRFFNYQGFVIDPHSVQDPVPMWLGGRTRASLRRALEVADGWDPFKLTLDELRALLTEARDWAVWRERQTPFDLALGLEWNEDVTHPAALTRLTDQVAKYQAAGATVLNLHFTSRSLEHYLEQIFIVSERVAPRFC